MKKKVFAEGLCGKKLFIIYSNSINIEWDLILGILFSEKDILLVINIVDWIPLIASIIALVLVIDWSVILVIFNSILDR